MHNNYIFFVFHYIIKSFFFQKFIFSDFFIVLRSYMLYILIVFVFLENEHFNIIK